MKKDWVGARNTFDTVFTWKPDRAGGAEASSSSSRQQSGPDHITTALLWRGGAGRAVGCWTAVQVSTFTLLPTN